VPGSAEAILRENPDTTAELRDGVAAAAREIAETAEPATLAERLLAYPEAVEALRADQQRAAEEYDRERQELEQQERERWERERQEQVPPPQYQPPVVPEPEDTPPPEATPEPEEPDPETTPAPETPESSPEDGSDAGSAGRPLSPGQLHDPPAPVR
jgi:hypothetical protein